MNVLLMVVRGLVRIDVRILMEDISVVAQFQVTSSPRTTNHTCIGIHAVLKYVKIFTVMQG